MKLSPAARMIAAAITMEACTISGARQLGMISRKTMVSTLIAPCLEHPLGTDELGRDVLARIVHGSRLSLEIALLSTAISLCLGGIIGAYAGYIGGRFDSVMMRVMDIFLAIPNMLLALAIVAALGPNLMNLIIAIAISDIPRFAGR